MPVDKLAYTANTKHRNWNFIRFCSLKNNVFSLFSSLSNHTIKIWQKSFNAQILLETKQGYSTYTSTMNSVVTRLQLQYQY